MVLVLMMWLPRWSVATKRGAQAMPLSKVVRVTGANWRGGVHAGDGGTPVGTSVAAVVKQPSVSR